MYGFRLMLYFTNFNLLIMSLISRLQATDTAQLLRAVNSQKGYLFFDISVFNTGTVINIKCTDTFKEINQNTWNGYDFILENDDTTKFYISNVLKDRIKNVLEDDLNENQIKRIKKIINN